MPQKAQLTHTHTHIHTSHISLTTDFSRMASNGKATSRSSLFPSCGTLYPSGSELLSSAEDEEGIRRALVKAAPTYAKLWGA